MLVADERAFSHLLDNYSTKAMADENQRSVFRIFLLPAFSVIGIKPWMEGIVTSLRLLSNAVSNWIAHRERRCFGAPKSHLDSWLKVMIRELGSFAGSRFSSASQLTCTSLSPSFTFLIHAQSGLAPRPCTATILR